MTEREVDRTFTVRRRRVVVRDLRTHVCEACGGRFLDARAAARVEVATGIARSRKRAARTAA